MGIARITATRDTIGRPIWKVSLPDEDRLFTLPQRWDRVEALLCQYGYKKMWRNWKRVQRSCPHGDCHKDIFRIRVEKQHD